MTFNNAVVSQTPKHNTQNCIHTVGQIPFKCPYMYVGNTLSWDFIASGLIWASFYKLIYAFKLPLPMNQYVNSTGTHLRISLVQYIKMLNKIKIFIPAEVCSLFTILPGKSMMMTFLYYLVCVNLRGNVNKCLYRVLFFHT